MRLVVDNLSKEYGGKLQALRGVKLTLGAGVLGLLVTANCYFDIHERECNIVTWIVQEL
jgi:hypothetical protein